ncbi:MAG: HDOD domain-containing protein [Phycisphaeraceae bacterium]|nr:HDOD domain-containing protein [Phycisphaeraceae bacterium]
MDTKQQVRQGTAPLSDYFIGRQPILDTDGNTYAYELLFRSGQLNQADVIDGTAATSSVLNCVMNVMGLPSLVGERLAFINVTEQTLLEGTYEVLPKDHAVIELLEDVQPSDAILQACQKLKSRGYMLALDDFCGRDDYDALLRLADIVKVDFMALDSAQRKKVTASLKPCGALLLAEKVETAEDVEEAKALGYSYFQGYYYQKPKVIQMQRLMPTQNAAMRLLQVINSESSSLDDIELAIKRDFVLTTRLLSYINSAFFGLGSRVTSIAHASKLLGILQMQKWASLFAVEELRGDHLPKELACDSIARGLFCEKIGPHLKDEISRLDLFMSGMLSLVDALTGMPKEQIAEQLGLKQDITDALLGKPGVLSDAIALAEACEQFDVRSVVVYAGRLQIDFATAIELHNDAASDAFRLVA